jgi:carbohydrate-selective porin OprB
VVETSGHFRRAAAAAVVAVVAAAAAAAAAAAFTSSLVVDSAAGRLCALKRKCLHTHFSFLVRKKETGRGGFKPQRRLGFYWWANTAGSRGSLGKKK